MDDLHRILDAVGGVVDKEKQKETELEKKAREIAWDINGNEDNWEGPYPQQKPPEPERKDYSNQAE